ncbi:ABC transporter ATP-binding protein [Candidatus Formimonas warabiya]|uniref:Sugar ABC transporter ATP-binding protein n=1 Tax=Formimonas warabiya TaxID=1761012 RepID=A0A3G1KZ19_FORW1|nr:ABC transporter ATP-binding protein [Candidatus Formimonas warabiya]ATW27728.1 sugar ABC transporter ATP-binding protein [Candidatus Formimonas warabiya]
MIAIEVKGVYKKFRIYYDKNKTLKTHILFWKRQRFEEFWALKNVNFTVDTGKTIGLIGQNGSGKSTLLKLLTKIIFPDQGKINLYGKVSSLLELGAGFHPDFTGKENIYMNASILGLTKRQIDNRLGEIIQFSELEEFIENPVRTYSSGMYMRLAFSIAINVNPDILLVDEVLAVGDASFQKKCLEKIKELKRDGKTIVFVSHDLSIIEKLCDEVIWVDGGIIKERGQCRRVIDSYLVFLAAKENQKMIHKNEMTNKKEALSSGSENQTSDVRKVTDSEPSVVDRWGNMKVLISDVKFLDENGQIKYVFDTSEKCVITFDYEVKNRIQDIVFGIGIYTSDGICCYGTNTYIERVDLEKISLQGKIFFEIPVVSLIEGTYLVDVAAHASDGLPYDYHSRRYSFKVHSEIKDVGIFRPEHKWRFL